MKIQSIEKSDRMWTRQNAVHIIWEYNNVLEIKMVQRNWWLVIKEYSK
jgi:hypothetical protein